MEAQADLSSFVCAAIRRSSSNALGPFSLTTPMATLNLDSLTLVSLVAQVESNYEVHLSPQEIVSLIESYRVSDLVGRLQDLIEKRQ